MSRPGDIVSGPLWAGRNWAADAGAGSIHDDDTATEHGFRGGTVPGDVHMNQFPPLLVRIFGEEWFERGSLSLNFKNATVDKEAVRVFAELPADGRQTRVWMEREDGMLVCDGTAALGDHSQSELRRRDLRPCDPSELTMLNGLASGMSLGRHQIFATPDRQFELLDAGLISDPLDYYREDSPWGGVIACPSTMVQYLWGVPLAELSAKLSPAVGLFGAIEIGHVNGPMLLNRSYRIESEVVCVGQSPKTEYLWFDTWADSAAGERVVNFRMMCRLLKAS